MSVVFSVIDRLELRPTLAAIGLNLDDQSFSSHPGAGYHLELSPPGVELGVLSQIGRPHREEDAVLVEDPDNT